MRKQKTFSLPKHPRRGEQKIIVEQEPGGIWMLVINETSAKPLPSLSNPQSPKQVLDALADVSGNKGVADFMAGGYSNS